MPDEPLHQPDPPQRRRPRYSGTHPRRFEHKYKELDPQRYADITQHVRAQGRTPAGTHVPILVRELLECVAAAPGEVAVDCTLGYGGHALEIIARLAPGGCFIGIDVDAAELTRTRERLIARGAVPPESPDAPSIHASDSQPPTPLGAMASQPNRAPDRVDWAPRGAGVRLEFVHGSFAGLPRVLAGLGLAGADVIYADLGVSSMQIDDPRRGFSYKHDGPLDMRMDARIARSAADWVRLLSREKLAAALAELADEPAAEAVAEAIVAARQVRAIETTRALARVIAQAAPADADAAVTRCFQALRVLVNNEQSALRELLRVVPECLNPGGRLALIAFHSGEDRLIKHALRASLDSGVYSEIAAEPLRPSAEEQRANPRSRPARLRWARRGRATAG